MGCWYYQWYANGMLKSVQKPSGAVVSFEYDALGRRTAKIAGKKITRYLWDGNVLLQEWKYDIAERPVLQVGELGELFYNRAEPITNLVTWIYEQGSFTPIAKLVDGERFSIISDYIGRPVQVFNDVGEIVWETEYDIYGRLKNLKGDRAFQPFRQVGQYEDVELDGLYYNRFRYYDSNSGSYISQDPIGLAGNNPNFYGYVYDSNSWIDPFGLTEHIIFPTESLHPNAQGIYTIDATGYHHTDKVSLYKSAELKEGFDSSKWISHHVDYDPNTNKMRMQLVSLEAHKKSHIGGVNDFETHHKVKYNTESASKIAKACH